jgi:hypothetical protein
VKLHSVAPSHLRRGLGWPDFLLCSHSIARTLKPTPPIP